MVSFFVKKVMEAMLSYYVAPILYEMQSPLMTAIGFVLTVLF